MRLITLIFLIGLAAHAEVYTLSSGGSAAVEDLLRKRGVLSESVEVNGARGDMEVLVLPQSMAETYALIKRFLPDGTVVRSNHLTVKSGRDRLLFVSMGDRKKTVVYRLRTNGNERAEPDWPDDLPRPDGARVRQVTRLKDRKGLYAEARVGGPSASATRRYGNTLEAHGWKPMGGDPASGIFFSGKRMVVIAAETMENGRNSVLGVYDRHIKAPAPITATKAPKK